MTIYDNTDEHNDVEFHNTIMFNGNMSCGYSGVLTGRYSAIKFYDDIYRNFDLPQLSVLMWIYPIRISIVANKKQTLFHFSSKRYKYGNYTFVLNENYQPILSYSNEVLTVTATSTDPIKYDEWHHIAAVYSQVNETILFYINGQPIPLQQTRSAVGMSPSATSEPTSQEGFQGFGNDDKLSTPFSGVIDEIYVFKCPVLPDMITNVANTCNRREGHTCPSPIHGICPDKLPFELDEQTPAPIESQPVSTPLNTSP
ncbi:hypothetical protein RF11_07988 [Thelohanellus kitauei]|uniref:LamG-like jellyroll fold domain-containing protein n=1 Tax=Thelohanellus kitauei TaxID=669202 RepID=A0A0C2MM25_THEKT|nr:hypothetical protein RF11_07988 [Thelohanellus kitauei]